MGMNEIKYKDCIGISTNGTLQPNAIDFSTKGGEHCKTYVELPKCIKSKNVEAHSISINYSPESWTKKRYEKCCRELEQHIDIQNKQLQAYKDKEDKLRELYKELYILDHLNGRLILNSVIKILAVS